MDKSRRARGRMRPRVHRRGCGNVAMKKARGEIARASDAVLMNTEFVEDSVTRSQAFSRSRAKKMRSPCKQQEKNTESGMRIQRAALSHKRLPLPLHDSTESTRRVLTRRNAKRVHRLF